jgi:hypothetical protein
VDAASSPPAVNPNPNPLDRLWDITFTENAASGSQGGGKAGIILGGIVAAIAVGIVVAYFVMPEKKRIEIFGAKRKPYVIPASQIDDEDIEAYSKFIKRK